MRVVPSALSFGFLSFALFACGGGGAMNDAAADVADAAPPMCNGTNVYQCAERGAPDYSREDSGTPGAAATMDQSAALTRANHWRTSTGLTPLAGSDALDQAATAHSQFMASTSQQTCWPGVHNEVMLAACPGFTGAGPGERMTAAGYSWSAAGEVIDWEATPEAAVDGWIWTVYHRLPFLSWNLVDVGYGRAQGPFLGNANAEHNTMDFGRPRSGRTGDRPAEPIVFPVPGQTNVPTGFLGGSEGPTPPAPAGAARWASNQHSGTVVSMHFPVTPIVVTEHHFYGCNPGTQICVEVPHTFLTPDNDPNHDLTDAVFLYADQRLDGGGAEYVTSITGTMGADNQPFTRTWAFTTGE